MRTILVVSASRFFREALVRLFQADSGLCVVGALEVSELLSQEVGKLHPEIVALNAGPEDANLAAVRLIHEAIPKAKILLIEMPGDRQAFLRAAHAGARGFLLRDASPKQIRAAAHRLMRDGVVCPPPLVGALFEALADGVGVNSLLARGACELTPRELQTVKLLAEGLENKEIAARLNLSLGTVKNHVHHILQKAHARHRSDLMKAASRSGPNPQDAKSESPPCPSVPGTRTPQGDRRLT